MNLFRSRSPLRPRNKGSRTTFAWVIWQSLVLISFAGAETASPLVSQSSLPSPVGNEDFAEVKAHSPFLRTVGLSEALVLTGIARIDDDVFATLVDTETKMAHLVSGTANALGWQLVGVRGDASDLESLTAKIQVEGGDIVSIRYEKLAPSKRNSSSRSGQANGIRLNDRELAEARNVARNPKADFSSDGFGNPPPPEIVAKLSRMTYQQRESLNREMISLRKRGLGSEQRRKIYVDKINQAIQRR